MKFRASSFNVSIGMVARPTDFEERCKAPHVLELSKSILALGREPISPLLVDGVQDAGKWRLIAGRDRLAACHVAGLTAVPVRVVDGATPLELRRLELAENVFRRTLDPAERQRQLAEYVRERAAEIQQQWDMGRVVNGKLIPHPGGPRLITPAVPPPSPPAERQREPGDDDDEVAPARFGVAATPGTAGTPGTFGSTCTESPTRPAHRPASATGEAIREGAPPRFAAVETSVTNVTEVSVPAHRPVSARGEAIREVAAASGRSVASVKMELSRHEAKPAAPQAARTLVELELVQLDRLAKKAVRLAGQVGDAGIIGAAAELARLVQVRVVSRLPADIRRALDEIAAPPGAGVDEHEPDEPMRPTLAPPDGFFEESAEMFDETLPAEVLR